MDKLNNELSAKSTWLHDMMIDQYNRGDSITVVLFPHVTAPVRKVLNSRMWEAEDAMGRPLTNLEEAVLTYRTYDESCDEPDEYLKFALGQVIRQIREKEGIDLPIA